MPCRAGTSQAPALAAGIGNKCCSRGNRGKRAQILARKQVPIGANRVGSQVEELVDLGELDPDSTVTPSIYVNRIIKSTATEKSIEKRTVRKRIDG